ncbi:gp15 [Alphaproteobacteria phage PhiJL001]|uniref:Gp15 n=1 Tax=Alphaproteobacteria phage PhiJL001 TaxID=2681607 RepID=Q5DN90_9CAUD|nr:gp15 [Alphaproteobacteria phage PhiJL001]AAT69491.1 gp15 [Alphaproteobacteria phage PhiJL001]
MEMFVESQVVTPSYSMLTLTDEYMPLLTDGPSNTIRKLSEKYENMMPGQMVEMTYVPAEYVTEDGKVVEGAILATERLTVSGVVIAPYQQIIAHHLFMNHGALADQATDHFEKIGKTREFFEKCYGEVNDLDMYMAIYFA